MIEKSHTGGFWPSLYEPLRTVGTKLAEWLTPASEASADKDAYHIAIELPGVAEDDIDLSVHDAVVTVKGEKRTSREESGDTWYFSERQYGAFSRSFRLPPDADADTIKAALKDGVLEISVGKRNDTAADGARRVQISRS